MFTASINDDACYLALKSRDARFDGQFFTAVTSTGIYCRPVCRVKAPKRENCRFFVHAAQLAHGHGAVKTTTTSLRLAAQVLLSIKVCSTAI
jgi:methylphosphotriester-DNA--protein-cysteine methyltransferase